MGLPQLGAPIAPRGSLSPAQQHGYDYEFRSDDAMLIRLPAATLRGVLACWWNLPCPTLSFGLEAPTISISSRLFGLTVNSSSSVTATIGVHSASFIPDHDELLGSTLTARGTKRSS